MMGGGNVKVGCKELFTMLRIGSNNQARDMQSCVESSAWNSSGKISAKRVQLELSRLRQIAIIMDSVMVYRKGEPGSIVAHVSAMERTADTVFGRLCASK